MVSACSTWRIQVKITQFETWTDGKIQKKQLISRELVSAKIEMQTMFWD